MLTFLCFSTVKECDYLGNEKKKISPPTPHFQSLLTPSRTSIDQICSNTSTPRGVSTPFKGRCIFATHETSSSFASGSNNPSTFLLNGQKKRIQTHFGGRPNFPTTSGRLHDWQLRPQKKQKKSPKDPPMHTLRRPAVCGCLWFVVPHEKSS